MKKGIIIGGIIIIGLGLFGIGWYSRPIYDTKQLDSASSQAKTYISDVLNGKPVDAYALTSSGLKDQQSQAKFVEAMKNVTSSKPSYGKVTVLKNQDGSVIYVQAVDGLPKTSNGRTSGLFTIMLVDQGGWKVNASSIN
jgi:hypothetical protein